MTQTATAPSPVKAAEELEPTVLSAVRRRLIPIEQRFDAYSWLATIGVVVIAAALRIWGLGHPKDLIFDELYYAKEANSMLDHGTEWDENGPKYVVHPPFGKWMISIGIRALGYDSVGWRISSVVAGVIAVLLITRIARRMTGSTVLGCAAGLLMTFDGMQFVLSRSALLDIFLMVFVLGAFGALVLDRDQRRKRWADFISNGGDPGGKGRVSRPAFAVPWWRLLAALLMGCALGVKWSALFFLPVMAILVIWWEIGARRSAGVRNYIRDAILDEIGWLLLVGVIIIGVYIATWTGWFLHDDAYMRHALRDSGQKELPFIGALQNLMSYHEQAYGFHQGLEESHTYQSAAWQWLLLGRPVAFYWSGDGPCGAAQCAAEVVLLGTPLLWWSFIPALIAALWFGIGRRDWRGITVVLMAVGALLPWFFYSKRTMFYFYALPAEPFLILAVVFVLGAIMTSPPGEPPSDSRNLVGTVVLGAFILLVALNFAYFYPLFIGESIPYADWAKRMWLGNRWI